MRAVACACATCCMRARTTATNCRVTPGRGHLRVQHQPPTSDEHAHTKLSRNERPRVSSGEVPRVPAGCRPDRRSVARSIVTLVRMTRSSGSGSCRYSKEHGIVLSATATHYNPSTTNKRLLVKINGVDTPSYERLLYYSFINILQTFLSYRKQLYLIIYTVI